MFIDIADIVHDGVVRINNEIDVETCFKEIKSNSEGNVIVDIMMKFKV